MSASNKHKTSEHDSQHKRVAMEGQVAKFTKGSVLPEWGKIFTPQNSR